MIGLIGHIHRKDLGHGYGFSNFLECLAGEAMTSESAYMDEAAEKRTKVLLKFKVRVFCLLNKQVYNLFCLEPGVIKCSLQNQPTIGKCFDMEIQTWWESDENIMPAPDYYQNVDD